MTLLEKARDLLADLHREPEQDADLKHAIIKLEAAVRALESREKKS